MFLKRRAHNFDDTIVWRNWWSDWLTSNAKNEECTWRNSNHNFLFDEVCRCVGCASALLQAIENDYCDCRSSMLGQQNTKNYINEFILSHSHGTGAQSAIQFSQINFFFFQKRLIDKCATNNTILTTGPLYRSVTSTVAAFNRFGFLGAQRDSHFSSFLNCVLKGIEAANFVSHI